MASLQQVAVVGAGIAGLCAAYWLKKKGNKVQVFERSGHAGGVIISERSDGFLVDYGPNSTLETSEVLTELVRELGLEEQKVYGQDASNNRYIVKDGQLQALPTSAGAFLSTGLFSWKAKLRLLGEPFISRTTGDDVSLADFVRHRLGREFLDYAINPFVAGVYAGDPEQLSTAAGFPKLYALEKNYGSLIKGTIQGARERKKRKEVAKNRARMFSFQDGMQVFTDALADRLDPDALHLHTEVTGLRREGDRFRLDMTSDGQSQSDLFDRVILTAPAYTLPKLLGELAPQQAGPLSEVRYPPVSLVYLGFRKADVQRELDGFGFLVPEVEQRQILGTLWSSAIFPGRAPDGHVALTTFVGGTRQPDNALLPEEELKDLVLRELRDLCGVRGEPVFSRMMRWERAIPQYRVGYKEVQAIFDQLESQYEGLYFAGNYRRGISVGDSVLSAHETVEKLGNRRTEEP